MPFEPPGLGPSVSPAAASPGPRFGDVVAADRLRAVSPVPQLFAESPQFLVQMRLEHRDRDVVDPGGSLVRCDLRERSVQSPFGVDLVNQAEPFASFDPLLRGLPTSALSKPSVRPRTVRSQGLSGTYSPCGHCHRLFFRRLGHRVSTSLHPLAPPELPGFFATMGALTPGRPALRLPGSMNTGFGIVQVSLLHVIEPSDHSVSNHLPSSRHVSGVSCCRLTGPHCCGRP